MARRRTVTRMKTNEARLGIDIGRVIIEGDRPGGDTSFIGGGMEDVFATPPTEHAFETVRRLVSRLDGRVWLVSKCGARVEAKTRAWLAHYRFFEQTGLPESHLRFCRERPQKRDHAIALQLTHFVDDRADVLAHLEGVVPHRILFTNWRDAEAAISGTLCE